MPGPEHAREPLDARPEDIDGRSDRPGLGATLSQAANIILEASRAYQASLDEFARMTDAHFEVQAIEAVKALMLAGWSAPSERTISIPNGLVLHRTQWWGLAEGDSAWIILPSGVTALELTVKSFQSPPSATVRDMLWKLREDSSDATRGSSTWDQHGLRDVVVPRSFLGFIVMLAAEFRRAGDYAAANSLDNALATIAPQLREAKIPWSDGGGATPASAPPMQSNDELTQLHRDIIDVLRYVSAGIGYTRTASTRYPDVAARRALGTIELKDVPVGTDTHGHPLPWWSPLRASAGAPAKSIDVKPVRDMTIGEVQQLIADYEAQHPEFTRVGTGPDTAITRPSSSESTHDQKTIVDLRHSLKSAHKTAERVRNVLLPFISAHPTTRDDVAGVDTSRIKVNYIADRAAELFRWYEIELERINREGIPGVVHEVDAAFHKLAIIERDAAWVESANRKRRIEELETELAELRTRVNPDAKHDGDD